MKIKPKTLITYLLIAINVIVLTAIFIIANRNTGHSQNSNNQTNAEEKKLNTYNNVSASGFNELIKKGGVEIIDVRTKEEYDTGHIKGAKLIPIDDFDKTLDKNPLPQDKKILVYCHSGNRSRTASTSLIARGFKDVYNLKNGILSWEQANLPLEK